MDNKSFSVLLSVSAYRDRNHERLEGLLAWQGQVYRRQVYGFNCLLMTVLLVVLILVTGVPSFNYRDNTLSPFWFPITCSFLLLSGLISLLLTHQLDRPWLPEKPEPKAVQCEEEMKSDGEERGESQPREVTKRSLCCRIGSCLATGLLVLLPCILSLIVFVSVQEQSPYLLLVHNNAGSETTVSLSILSGLAIHSPSSGDLSTTSGPASTDCSFIGTGSNLRGAILLVNSTKLACLVLLSSGKLVEEASKVSILFVVYELYHCTSSGWLQGRGVVGQHSPGAVASLLPPLFVLHGTGCVLTGGNPCVDDQRGRLEKS